MNRKNQEIETKPYWFNIREKLLTFKEQLLTFKGQLLTFIIEFLLAAIIVQLIITFKIKEGFLYSILSEGLAPTRIGLFTAIIGLHLIHISYKLFKKRNIFGGLSPLRVRGCISWMRDTLIISIITLLAIRSAGLSIMSLNSITLPSGLSYKQILIYFLENNVIAFISLYMMLSAPFINFKKWLKTSNSTIHTILFLLYFALGLGIFTIPLLGSTWK